MPNLVCYRVLMAERKRRSNAGSHVNRIPGVRLDDDGFIHTAYGSYHPTTGQGLPIKAPDDLTRQILIALIDDGIDRGPAKPFDWDAFMERKFGPEGDMRRN
jgi:hypothetical protein